MADEPKTQFEPRTEPTSPADDTAPNRAARRPASPDRSPGLGRPLDYWLLWLVALGSLALNVWLINTLLNVKRQAAKAVSEAAITVGQIQLGDMDFTVPVDQTIEVNDVIPISDTLHVPISLTLPINSLVIVQVPILGPQALPFSTKVPINFEVDVPLRLAYPISLSVPVKFDVPVHIALDETPLADVKTGIQSYLIDLAQELSSMPSSK